LAPLIDKCRGGELSKELSQLDPLILYSFDQPVALRTYDMTIVDVHQARTVF
jgi:hypothetical protein